MNADHSRQVNPEIAAEVAAGFVAGRSDRRDPVVVAAYGQLREQSDRMYEQLTDTRSRQPIRVVFTRQRQPYGTEWEMISAVRSDHLLEVSTAAADSECRHPLMDCAAGGAFDRFRAVHDVMGHAWPSLGFDRDGEYAAWLHQERFYGGLARRALATELHGKHSVLWTTGVLADNKAILLDHDLLNRSRAASGHRG